MKNNIYKIIFAAILFCSCKKNTEPAATLSRTALITSSGWTLTAYTQVRMADGFSQDAYAPMSACYKDDVYTFKPDYTYEGSVGPVKCSPAQPQVFQSGTWRFDNNETILERNITAGSNISVTRFTVVSVTTSELKLQLNDGTYIHNVTYSH